MLKQRIITAIVLLVVFLPAILAHSPSPLLGLLLVVLGVAAWEWARLAGLNAPWSWLFPVLVAAACALAWWAGLAARLPGPAWLLLAAGWVLLGGWGLRQGGQHWRRLALLPRLLIGVVVLCTAWLAVARVRQFGVNTLLSVLVLVWAADIGAYFMGRRFGGRWTSGRRLAPAISPGKTWEGLLGGLGLVLLVALVWVGLDRASDVQSLSLFRHLQQTGWLLFFVSVPFLVLLSVVGDLFESVIKRAAGAKDSSQLLPGHGGVLDRIDALLPTFVWAAALLVILRESVA